MITCASKRLCSTDYILSHGERVADLSFSIMLEQDAIAIDHAAYDACKPKPLRSRWTPERARIVSEAEKPSMFRGGLSLLAGGNEFALERRGFWSPRFELHLNDHLIAALRKVHAFWLVSAMWKRDAEAASP